MPTGIIHTRLRLYRRYNFVPMSVPVGYWVPIERLLCYKPEGLNQTHQIINFLIVITNRQNTNTEIRRTNKEETKKATIARDDRFPYNMQSLLIAGQERGEHEHLAGDGEEHEDGQIPRPLPPGPIYALGLGVEVLGPTQRVHLLEQSKWRPLCLSSETHLAKSSASSRYHARRRSRLTSMSDLYR